MHDNGLAANGWAFLVDVAPPIAMELLDLLGSAGIPARATPYESHDPSGYNAIGRQHGLNEGPMERVDVDITRRVEAVQVMSEHLPQAVAPLEQAAADSSRIDAEFRSIVAGLGPATDEPRQRSYREIDPSEAGSGGQDGRTAGYADPLAAGYGRGEAEGYPNLLDEDDEGYVPPEPPPIPRGSSAQRLAWAALILGPIYLLIQGSTDWGLGPLGNLVAIVAIAVAFIYLLSTLRDSRDDEDDGAVV